MTADQRAMTGRMRASSLWRSWQRRHSNGWVSVMYEYADGLFAGTAESPGQSGPVNPATVYLFFETGTHAMAYADQAVMRISRHQCDDGCEPWAAASRQTGEPQ